MTTQRALPQSKEALLKSYMTRLKDDVKSMLENFEGILTYILKNSNLHFSFLSIIWIIWIFTYMFLFSFLI